MFYYPTHDLYNLAIKEYYDQGDHTFQNLLDQVIEPTWLDPEGPRNDVLRNPYEGFIKELTAAEWNEFDWSIIRKFMHFYPIYVLPTTELLDKLDELIGDYDTIEIGAGSGNIGRHLDIKMTDSYQQTMDHQTAYFYKTFKQPTPHYPQNVFKADALMAIRRFKPECVLGCYVTHKWAKGMKTGNSKGVDFLRVLKNVKRLILVGNENIHSENPIMYFPHQKIQVDGLITRNDDRSADHIYVWDTDKLAL